MKTKNIKIKISTRILLYFFFVTILPLAILALSSTFLIHSSLNEKSEQELASRLESLQSLYYKVLTGYKSIVNSPSFIDLSSKLENNRRYTLNKAVIKIKDSHKLSFVVLFDANLKLLASTSNPEPLFLYPVNSYESLLIDMFEVAKKGNLPVSNELLSREQLRTWNLNNKLVLKQEYVNKIPDPEFGMLAQVGIIPIFKRNERNYSIIQETSEENNPLVNHDTSLPPDRQNFKPIGYIIVGNFINSSKDITSLLKDLHDVPVNIVQSNTIVASNSNIPFDITSLEMGKTRKIFASQKYRGEQFVNNRWFRIATEPINNFKGQTIATMVVGLEEDIFRSLKTKNSLLMVQVAFLVAMGGLALAFLFTKNLTDPIAKMITAVRSIAVEEPYTLVIPTEDELGELAVSINQMAQSLEERKSEILDYNKALLDQKTKLETIFNYSADGIMTVSIDKKITSINNVIVKWLGLPQQEIINKRFYEVISYSPDIPRSYSASINFDQIDDLTIFSNFYPNARINNIELEISYSPIKLDENTIISYVLILRDITKRKESEELRENFIATLTHDLRVPLLAAVHTLDYLLKGSYGELTVKQKYITEQLISSNQDLLRMVNTLLDAYSYEAGKQSLVKREINLTRLIQESINELQYLAEDKQHEIIFNYDESVMVIADKQEIKRVIVNLLSNAIIHTPGKGMLEFLIRYETPFVIVSIKDNGVGLSEKDKEIVFQRYARGGKTLRKVGTGLGLYLSRHIVEAHGGKIWVESKLNEGSTFSFSLPISKDRLELIDDKDHSSYS